MPNRNRNQQTAPGPGEASMGNIQENKKVGGKDNREQRVDYNKKEGTGSNGSPNRNGDNKSGTTKK
jgi:hypothetical protein